MICLSLVDAQLIGVELLELAGERGGDLFAGGDGSPGHVLRLAAGSVGRQTGRRLVGHGRALLSH